MITQKGFAHIILTVIIVVVLAGGLGLLYWNNYVSSSSSTKSAGYIPSTKMSEKEIEACRERVAEANPQPKGLSDHRDYSECSTNIIALEKLSEQQKAENKENTEIIMKARQNRNSDDCNKIEGMYFTAYPPAMNKVIMRTTDEARYECQGLVQYELKKLQQNRGN